MEERAQLSILWPTTWEEYELLDSGNGMRYERFGEYTLVRPDSQALWAPRLPEEEWGRADALFNAEQEGDNWIRRRRIDEPWTLQYGALRFEARLTPFKHTGIFPEQAVNWEWVANLVRNAGREIRVLNLFAYTGLATLSAAEAGALVTHVDASRPAMNWARDNQRVAGMEALPIRWLIDDALKFVRREVRRGNQYEGIILDPPAFGRGPKGEIWRFSENFPEMMRVARQILSDNPLFVLVNAYAVSESALVLRNLLAEMVSGHEGELEAGELALRERGPDGRLLPASLFSRWSARKAR